VAVVLLPSAPVSRSFRQTQGKDRTTTSTYPLDELLHRWKVGQLTPEQAIGHLLQHVAALSKQVAEQERRLRQCEQRPTAP